MTPFEAMFPECPSDSPEARLLPELLPVLAPHDAATVLNVLIVTYRHLCVQLPEQHAAGARVLAAISGELQMLANGAHANPPEGERALTTTRTTAITTAITTTRPRTRNTTTH